MLALRLFLPESSTRNRARLERAGVPAEYRVARTKPEIALTDIAAGVRFGCVLADAGYGLSAPFRQGLTARNLTWAVGIPRHLKVYPADVQIIWPVPSAVEKNSASIISGTSQTFYRYRPKTMQALPGSALEVPTRAAGSPRGGQPPRLYWTGCLILR
jgi:SRSO17 transposase